MSSASPIGIVPMFRATSGGQSWLVGYEVSMPFTPFASVFAAHHADAVRLAYLLCGDRTRAEDVVSDAFVKLYRRWQRGGIANPRAYLRRAVVNELNSAFRRLALERREAAKRSGDRRGVRRTDDLVSDHAAVVGALAELRADA